MDKDWGLVTFGFSYTSLFASPEDLAGTGAQNDVYSVNAINEHDPFPTLPDLGSGGKMPYNQWMDWPEIEPLAFKYDDPAEFSRDSAIWFDQAQYKQNDTVEYTIDGHYHVWDKENNKTGDPLDGDYFSNSIGANVAIGYKTESFVHSVQLNYSYKLSSEWYVRGADTADVVYESDPYVKKIYLNPVLREERHNFSIAYGLEMSSMTFPFFLGWNLAFNEKEFQNMTMSVGVRGSFF
jgi:hypothetical protein